MVSFSAEYEALARAALSEVTPDKTVGELVATTQESDTVTSLAFSTYLPGYPRGRWMVTVAQLPGTEPTVLEANLIPEPTLRD